MARSFEEKPYQGDVLLKKKKRLLLKCVLVSLRQRISGCNRQSLPPAPSSSSPSPRTPRAPASQNEGSRGDRPLPHPLLGHPSNLLPCKPCDHGLDGHGQGGRSYRLEKDVGKGVQRVSQCGEPTVFIGVQGLLFTSIHSNH